MINKQHPKTKKYLNQRQTPIFRLWHLPTLTYALISLVAMLALTGCYIPPSETEITSTTEISNTPIATESTTLPTATIATVQPATDIVVSATETTFVVGHCWLLGWAA